MRIIASILALFFIPFTIVSLSAQQVTHDNNFMSLQTDGFSPGTINFTVPPGEKKVLLVGIAQYVNEVTNVDFAGMPMTLFVSQTSNSIFSNTSTEYSYYYIVLGDVSSPVAGNINVTENGPFPDTRQTFAISFNNVDQTMPVSGFVTTSSPQGTVVPSTLTLNVPSTTNDLVLDFFTGINNSIVSGQDQSQLGSISRPPLLALGLVSVKNGSAVSTTMSQTLTSGSAFGVFYSALSIKACPEAIPTLTQWSFAILSLMLMIVGVVILRQNEVIKLA